MSQPLLVGLLVVAILILAGALLVAVLRGRGGRGARLDEERSKIELMSRVGETGRRLTELQEIFNKQFTDTQRLLQERLAGQDKALREQLSSQTTSLQGQTGILQKHMENTQTTLTEVTEKMGMVQQASLRMAELGKDIEDLQRLLKAPKARGELGELGLEILLTDILPAGYVTYQYGFQDGRVVDAVIRLQRGLLPVDAKFPVEDFQRYVEAEEEERPRARREFLKNIKKKIDEIARHYVRPGEGTLPLALMYLPAESLYYEAFVAREKGEDNLWDYAFKRSVLALSPATMVAFLKTVAMGLNAAAVEKNAGRVLELLATLERDMAAFTASHDVLGGHISKAHAKFQESRRDLDSLAEHLARAKDMGKGPGEEGD